MSQVLNLASARKSARCESAFSTASCATSSACVGSKCAVFAPIASRLRQTNTTGLDRAPGSLIGRVFYERQFAKDRYLIRLQAVVTKRVTICIGEPVVAANHQHKLAPPVLKCVGFRAPVAKPEVSYRVHVCRRFA